MNLIHGPIRAGEGYSWRLLRNLILLTAHVLGLLLQNLNFYRYEQPSLFQKVRIKQLVTFSLVVKCAHFHNVHDLGINLVNENHVANVLGDILTDLFESVAFVL